MRKRERHSLFFFTKMTQFLPPNLLVLFTARDMPIYMAPLDKLTHEKKRQPYAGVAEFMQHFEVSSVFNIWSGHPINLATAFEGSIFLCGKVKFKKISTYKGFSRTDMCCHSVAIFVVVFYLVYCFVRLIEYHCGIY